MAGIREGLGFSYGEREEFQRAFEHATARLPVMFRSFLYRWEETSGPPPEFIIYAEDGTRTLRLTRLNYGGYRAAGITGKGAVIYAVAARSITDAFKSAGLL
jgi:hypothetical protein